MQGQHGLLLPALDRHEPHLGPGPGHAQGRGIRGVVLLALFHERPDCLGRDQLHLVAKAAQQTRPVMAGTTGLEDHGASGLLLEERDQLAPTQLALERHPSTLVNAVDLEDSLCGVQPDHAYRHRGRLLFRFARPEFGTSMPGAVHPIRKDARGIAQLLRMGWYRPVHRKSPPAREIRALLVGRKLLQGKLLDVELSIRGILRGFGLKVGVVSKGRFAPRIRELIGGQTMLERVIEPMLRAREALRAECHALHRAMLGIVREDTTCRRLMTVPGVGALVAITFTSAVDEPGRFTRSRTVGAHFGLTPKKYQSGETDVTGGISKVGDAMVRSALYEAANVMLTRASRFSSLKRWALEVAGRRGTKRAKVALARKLATILHRMWVDGTSFRFGKEVAAAA